MRVPEVLVPSVWSVEMTLGTHDTLRKIDGTERAIMLLNIDRPTEARALLLQMELVTQLN